jgi:hypothetical protein
MKKKEIKATFTYGKKTLTVTGKVSKKAAKDGAMWFNNVVEGIISKSKKSKVRNS